MRFIKDLIEEYHCKSEASVYLESLAYQMQEAGNDPASIKKDLVHAAEIASRYSDSLSALKVLDKALEHYFQLEKKLPYGRLGSLQYLNQEEHRLAQSGIRIVLKGLESRIEDCFLSRTGSRESESLLDDEDLQEMGTYQLTQRNILKKA